MAYGKCYIIGNYSTTHELMHKMYITHEVLCKTSHYKCSVQKCNTMYEMCRVGRENVQSR